MDYEKAYKEALERARKSHDKSNGFIKKEWIETIFPELKESEEERDKRMWKLIKKYAHSNISITVLDTDNITRDQLESWLEKQEKQNSAWSEDDERMFHKIIGELAPLGECPDYPSEEDREYYYGRTAMINWLKKKLQH